MVGDKDEAARLGITDLPRARVELPTSSHSRPRSRPGTSTLQSTSLQTQHFRHRSSGLIIQFPFRTLWLHIPQCLLRVSCTSVHTCLKVSLTRLPAGGQRALSQKDLPPSVETAYYRKCIELRRRINDIEENNDGTRLRIKRLHRGIIKMRLERAFLLEQLHKNMEYNADDSDRSSSPPPTPTDKPLRSKRGHNRQKTPPPGGVQMGGGSVLGAQQPSPGSVQHQHVLSAMNPMSSAQSTPDPSRSAPFFSTIPPPASSPYAVNGTSQPALPPLHASQLPPLQPQQPSEPSRGAYYDPTQEESRPSENDAEYSGRRRAHSSAQAPPSSTLEAQNGESTPQDTEMADAPGGGFTAVNRST